MKNKKPFGGEKPRRFAPTTGKFSGSKPASKGKSPYSGGSKGAGYGGGTEERASFGAKPGFKKKTFGAKGPGAGSFAKRAFSDDRPPRPYGGDRPGGYEKRDRDFSSDRPRFEGKKPYGSDRPSDRPERRPYAGGSKPAYGGPARKPDFGPARPRPYGASRPDSDRDRPYSSDRPQRPSYSDKPRFGQGDRPRFGQGDRPQGDRPRYGQGDKPRFGQSDRPRFGQGDRPQGDRPRFGQGDRPRFGQGDRPQGDRPRFGQGDRPKYQGSRPEGEKREWGQKPDRGYGDNRPSRPYDSGKPRQFEAKSKGYGSPDRGGFNRQGSYPGPEQKPYEDRKPWAPEQQEETKPLDYLDASETPDDSVIPSDEDTEVTETDKGTWKNSGTPFHDPDRDDAPRIRSANPLKNKTFIPGLTAKKLIVTLADTKTVPVRLVWIYESMVGALPDGQPSAGDTVHVHDDNDRFLGSAIYNPHSKITARIFSVTKTLFNEAYIEGAISEAIKLRRSLGMLSESCRVIFGDSDGLPGLIADKIGDYLVVQPLTYAIDRRIGKIVDLLNEQLGPQGIIVRNDAPIRAKEGLIVGDPVIHGEIPERVKVVEDGLVLYADTAGGQKTGLFLDQRLNREVLKPFSKGAKVLDLFCHVGGWAMRAAKYGAAEVIGVDSSKPALELAKAAAETNGFEQLSFVDKDVFDYLKDLELDAEGLFDIIVCDPPAFAKTRAHFEDAFRAYLSLNHMVMKKLKPGGILVTCSCSQAVSSYEFGEAILTAARNARMQFQIIERRGAPQDHPVLLGLPETDYLKCFVLRRTE